MKQVITVTGDAKIEVAEPTEEIFRLAAYHIKDLGDGKKGIWTKIGTAFRNRDGTLNCLLEALPVDGRIHICPERKKK